MSHRLSHRFPISWLVALVGWLFVLPVLSTSLIEMPLSEIAQEASVVFIGKVKRQFTAEKNGMIYTYALVQVERLLSKGLLGDEVVLVIPGGIFENKGVRIHGLAPVQMNERGVYFVKAIDDQVHRDTNYADKYYGIVGMGQGRYTILTDRQSGEDMVVRADLNVTLVSKVKMQTAEKPMRRSPLSTFIEEVGKYIELEAKR